MPLFIIKKENIIDNCLHIEGTDFKHLTKVRRAKVGDTIDAATPCGKVSAIITQISDDKVIAEIQCLNAKSESPNVDIFLTAYLSLLKGKSFENAIQKCVEIGVHSIVPVISKRTVPDIDGKIEKKCVRWNVIAKEAAKQSLRDAAPKVFEPRKFCDVVSFADDDVKMIAHPASETDLKSFLDKQTHFCSVGILIGPEGGFDDSELLSAQNADWIGVNFGFSVMRAETAALVLPAVVVYELWGKKNRKLPDTI